MTDSPPSSDTRQTRSGPRALLFSSLSLPLFFFFPTGLFILPQLLVGVRRAEAEHRKGDLQGDFTHSSPCLVPELWTGPPPDSPPPPPPPPAEAWQPLLARLRGNLNSPSALWTTDLQTQTPLLPVIPLRLVEELLSVRTVSVSAA